MYKLYLVELAVLLPEGLFTSEFTQWFESQEEIEDFKAKMLEAHDICIVDEFSIILDQGKESFD